MAGGEPAPPRPVRLLRLRLADFRNHPALDLDMEAPLIAIAGPNGAGKTNLLEAISLLSPGRGLRRAPFEAIARAEAPGDGASGGWSVSAKIADGAGPPVTIGTGLVTEASGERARRVRVDGATVASAEALLDHLRLLWLTPAMDGLFTGPAAERRRFLDRLTLSIRPEHGRVAVDFERQLRTRNRLLGEWGAEAWLDAAERPLAEAAVRLSTARAETVEALSASVGAQAAEVGDAFPPAGLSLSGEFEDATLGFDFEEAVDRFRRTLRDARPRDRAAGRTLDGPHRSDLDVTFLAKAMPAALSSTGEQKALLIGLILAQAQVIGEKAGMTPVLLLDEVAAHLDPDRRAALFRRLDRLGCQSFMTGTETSLFSALGPNGALIRLGETTGHTAPAARPEADARLDQPGG